MQAKGNQNIFDFVLQAFGTLENLFTDVLVPNSLNADGEVQSNQEININAVGKGDDDIKMKISEQGLILTNGDIPIIVEYRNGIVTDAEFGETATFDFEVRANFSGLVNFTINWGDEVGTTTLSSTLSNGVWKALQTSISIPEGISANQTILVTDNFGGSFEVEYVIADGRFIFTINTALDTGDNFQLPLPSGETYNFVVNWGDGNEDTITVYNQAETLHNYSGAFNGQISITGKCGGWSFNNAGDKLKITSVDNWGAVEFDEINFGFFGCMNLALLPATGSIDGTSNIQDITSLFRGCTSLITTTSDVFKKLTSLVSALNIFHTCTSLVTIEADLFKNNTGLLNIASAFFGCSATTAIPVDFLRYNTALTNITSLFAFCYNLTTVPNDLLRYNTLLTTVAGLFNTCYLKLRALPEDLFYYNSLITAYNGVFLSCRNIVLPTRMFNTANLSIVTSFNAFMQADNTIYSFTGTIQDIWTPASSALHTNTFLNQTSISNYASIPNNWKGL